MKAANKLPVSAEHKAAAMPATPGKINVLDEDVCLPAVVVKAQALDNNIRWMQRYAASSDVSLAPHGKTTMTPAIFRRQVEAGAWGIGVGTAFQAKVAIEAGVPNVIMANQLVGKANIRLVSQLMKHSATPIYCCVDSAANARQLSDYFASQGQKMRVLLELGVPGGRCGCRSEEEAYALAALIQRLPGLTLCGVEFYEGVIHSDDERADLQTIDAFLKRVLTVTQRLAADGAFAGVDEALLTGAGTVWYDVVCQQMKQADLPTGFRYAIRPGCYITHDRGVYAQAQEALRARDPLSCDLGGDLASALELVAGVQSLPEPGLAILGFGKRDVAFDTGLPQPIALYRDGQRMPFEADSAHTENLMDQHAMLRYGKGLSLQVGDLLVFGTSHPCITFDKWKTIYLVDEDYNVLEAMETAF